MAAGGLAVLIGGAVSLQAYVAGQEWRTSPEAAEAQRNLNAPQPVWITPAPGATRVAAARQARPTAPPTSPAANTTAARPAVQPTATPQPAAASDAAAQPASEPAPPPPTPTLGPSPLHLGEVSFRFADPPEPGAHAALNLRIHNPTDEAEGSVAVLLPRDWLKGYRVDDTDPPQAPAEAQPTATASDAPLRLVFDGPAAGDDLDVQIQVTTTDEVIDAPAVRVLDGEGRTVGEAQPTTEAPPAQPGPVYSLDIPRLQLKTGVVQVDWEPPLFVVGQLRTSAHVTEGNTVLVGHVRGAPGYNVFDHLDQVAIGDPIVASSRGQTYQFVVSTTEVLPEDDTSPTVSTASPRLTLMTCAGQWNPITRDYADRLWVIAEPPEAAAATIAARARAAATPTPAPMSRFAQVSPPGGLGNTDTDFEQTFGPPTGELAAQHLVVYAGQTHATPSAAGTGPIPSPATSAGQTRAMLDDTGGARRALLVAAIPPATSPLDFDAAVHWSRQWLPRDAQPRAARPEGNPQFVVERFSSAALAVALPAAAFTDRQGQPGDFLVVYARQPDGRIRGLAVGIGDDPATVLAALDGG